MSELSVAVFASRVRLEEKLILETLERRRVPHVHVDTRRFRAPIPMPAPPYAAVLLREISHTRAVYAARLLEAAGVPTVNTAGTIEICGDKLLTSLTLMRAGLPTPRTVAALSADAALEAMEEMGFPVVIKPLTGSWGRMIAVLRDAETARTVLEHRAALPGPQHQVAYLQELVDKPDRDIRVLVAGATVLGATWRHSRDWRTNVARGAVSEPCPVSDDIAKLATAAAVAVGGGILGVDLIEDRDGRLSVLEVNHTVEFRGFLEAHGGDVDVADAIVDHLMSVAAP